MEMMLEVAIGVMNIEVVDMVLKFPYEDFTYVIFGFQDHHRNHDWTHGERRSQDHCFKINPQLANIIVAPDCKKMMVKMVMVKMMMVIVKMMMVQMMMVMFGVMVVMMMMMVALMRDWNDFHCGPL